ncbi:9455_t:CDS:2, partial [Dentiscutata erythropus]
NLIKIDSGGFGKVYKANYGAKMFVALKSYLDDSNMKEIVNEEVVNQQNYGIRERIVEGTPIGYSKIFQQCWQTDPNLRPTMDQVYDALKNVDLNSPVHTDQTPQTPVCINSANNINLEICIDDFHNNILRQNDNITQRYESWDFEANKLWDTLVDLTNVGRDFAQISKMIIEREKESIKYIFDWLEHQNEKKELDSNLKCLYGFFYFMGISTKKNHETAYKLFKEAAKTNATAVFYLGECFRCGYYVEKSLEKAIEFYKKSEDECERSIDALGFCYLNGIGGAVVCFNSLNRVTYIIIDLLNQYEDRKQRTIEIFFPIWFN